MTILITTAAGKIGSTLVETLRAQGKTVRVGAHHPEKLKASWGDAVVAFDYTDRASMLAALKGVEAVFSAAPYPLLPQAEIALVEAMKAAGVKRLVKLSAMGVENDDTGPHRVAEKAIEASGLEYTFLRPSFFMQNYSVTMAGMVQGGAIYEPAADGKTSFVDARDIAAVAAKALTEAGHHGKAYTLTGPEALGRAEVAAILSEATGRTITYVPVDDNALRQGMAGAPEVLIDLMVRLYGFVRAGWTATVVPTVQEVLGRPPISFRQFARDNAAVWK